MITTTARTAGKRRAEQRVIESVRSYVMDVRDATCRAANKGVGPCGGVEEWAHLGDKRRCFTRKMAPEDRHASAWTMKLCTAHHRLYDAHGFAVQFLDPLRGADGPCRFESAQYVVEEPDRG